MSHYEAIEAIEIEMCFNFIIDFLVDTTTWCQKTKLCFVVRTPAPHPACMLFDLLSHVNKA